MLARRHITGSRTRGMTLIEILAVMSIILILAGAFTGAGFALLKRGQRTSTENTLKAIATALDTYQTEHRMFVPGGQGNTGEVSSRPLWYALEFTAGHARTSGKFKQQDTVDVTDPTDNDRVTGWIYIDAWKQPIRYTCSAPWRTYEIRSKGPDLQLNTDDDIVETY